VQGEREKKVLLAEGERERTPFSTRDSLKEELKHHSFLEMGEGGH